LKDLDLHKNTSIKIYQSNQFIAVLRLNILVLRATARDSCEFTSANGQLHRWSLREFRQYWTGARIDNSHRFRNRHEAFLAACVRDKSNEPLKEVIASATLTRARRFLTRYFHCTFSATHPILISRCHFPLLIADRW